MPACVHHPAPRRRPRPIPFLLLVATLAACGGGGSSGDVSITPPVTTPGGPVATTAVTMRSLAFDPPAIVVSPGAVVRFTNQDGIDHNVTFDDSSIGGTGNFSGGTASLIMPTATGTYGYHCTLHAGMSGSVKVE